MSLGKYINIKENIPPTQQNNAESNRYIALCKFSKTGYSNYDPYEYIEKFDVTIEYVFSDIFSELAEKILIAGKINDESFKFNYERSRNPNFTNVEIVFVFDQLENKFIKYSKSNLTRSAYWKKIIQDRKDKKSKVKEHCKKIRNENHTKNNRSPIGQFVENDNGKFSFEINNVSDEKDGIRRSLILAGK